ncbi:unnamed protein product [Larinioides sclopetarius]|uniref:Uncharacterized protein n=1 Tax=Larinioides sclopetarius TaxID=280406 RepID=A0AAV2BP04_9ARAC
MNQRMRRYWAPKETQEFFPNETRSGAFFAVQCLCVILHPEKAACQRFKHLTTVKEAVGD